MWGLVFDMPGEVLLIINETLSRSFTVFKVFTGKDQEFPCPTYFENPQSLNTGYSFRSRASATGVDLQIFYGALNHKAITTFPSNYYELKSKF